MKKKTVLAGLAIFGILLALVLVRALAARDAPDSDVEFFTAEISRGSLVSTVTATGRVKALLDVDVGTQISGQIAKLYADFNDTVTAGQPLAQLDARTYEAQTLEATANLDVARANVLLQQAAIAVGRERIASAQAEFDEAERKLERFEALKKDGSVSQAALDEARASYQSAAAALRAEQGQIQVREAQLMDAEARVAREEALLAQAKIELSRTLITAPIDGVIVGRGVEEGQTVAASLQAPTLFQIAQDLSQMEVHVSVDEADIGQIEIGQAIRFTVDAYPADVFTGSVTEVRKSPSVYNNVVTYTVVVSAQNPELLLLPGMTATVQMVVLEVENALRIPNAALRFRPPSGWAEQRKHEASPVDEASAGRPAIVWVQRLLGDPEPVEVRIGPSDGSATELLAGDLDAGDEVVVGMRRAPGKRSVFGIRLGS